MQGIFDAVGLSTDGGPRQTCPFSQGVANVSFVLGHSKPFGQRRHSLQVMERRVRLDAQKVTSRVACLKIDEVANSTSRGSHFGTLSCIKINTTVLLGWARNYRRVLWSLK